MKKADARFIRSLMAGVPALILGSMMLGACVKGSVNSNVVSNAAMLVVNLAPDQSAVNVTLSGAALTGSPLAYTSYTGSYLSFASGSYLVASSNAGSTLSSGNYIFSGNTYYSLFLLGNNNSYHNIISIDTFSNFTTGLGNAYVRYVNAIVDSANFANVNVSKGTTTVFNEKALFGSVSGFKVVPAGTVAVHVTSAAAVDTTNSFVAGQDYAYTILLSGVPGATDASKKVQIRFLPNGSLVK